MKISLSLKLGIAVAALFAIVIAGMSAYPALRFRWHASRLASENQEAQLEAFRFLSGKGKRGRRTIEDFCIRNTDKGWGKLTGGLKTRILSSQLVYRYVRFKSDGPPVIPFFIEEEILNLGKEELELYFGCRSPPVDIIVGEIIQDRIFSPYEEIERFPAGGPVIRSTVRKGEIYSIRLPLNLPERHNFDEPGIYTIQAVFNPNSGYRRLNKMKPLSPERPSVTSNKICIAVLPPGGK